MTAVYIGLIPYLMIFAVSVIDHYINLETAGLCECENLLQCRKTHVVATATALLSYGIAYIAL